MPTLDEVYRRFGEASEAAQLLESDLGTLFLEHECIDAGLLEHSDPERATAIYAQVDRQTLGQLIQSLRPIDESIAGLEQVLAAAPASRNRLAHSFYLQHNLRRNSDYGRDVMLRDLEAIHDDLLEAIKALSLLSGIDLERLAEEHGDGPLPTGHLPIPT